MVSSPQKGSEGALGDCRPVDLVSVWSKSVGSGLKGRVDAHLGKQNILGKSYHDVRLHRSVGMSLEESSLMRRGIHVDGFPELSEMRSAVQNRKAVSQSVE